MNIPNILSLFRLALVPVFPLMLFSGLPHARYWAVLVYVVASLTDVLDGWVARRFGMITRLGRILDPLADKIMASTVIFCVAYLNLAPWWAVAVFFGKEVLMGIGAIAQYRRIEDVGSSVVFGKLSAAVFFVVCVLLLVIPDLPWVISFAMISIAVAFSILAFSYYCKIYFINKKSQE